MFDLVRNIAFGLFILLVVIGGGAYAVYGTLEPCQMLAQEQSKDVISQVSRDFGGDGTSIGQSLDDIVQNTFRAITSQYSTGECVEMLANGWWDEIWS